MLGIHWSDGQWQAGGGLDPRAGLEANQNLAQGVVKGAAGEHLIGAGIAGGLQGFAVHVRAEGQDPHGTVGVGGGGATEAGEHVHGGFGGFEVEDQAPDFPFGKASLEHVE